MRVLHLAPLWQPVGQDAHGGIETLLAGLLVEQRRLGCGLTLIASAESRVPGGVELVAPVDVSLVAQMGAGTAWEYLYYEQESLALAIERALAGDVDVIHSHVGAAAFPLSAAGLPVLHTWHNDITVDLEWAVSVRPDLRLSAVSDAQAAHLRASGARQCRVVPNGIDVDAFRFQDMPGEGLAFLGRMEAEKGPDLAIAAARALGRPLTLAGPVVDHAFFHDAVVPALGPDVQYAGILGHDDKVELLGRSSCVLMPSRFEEGFGLVAVEAMACGTPVVALSNGALAEVIDADVSGYTTDDATELPDLVRRAEKLHRADVRAQAATRFSLARAARRYVELYADIVEHRW